MGQSRNTASPRASVSSPHQAPSPRDPRQRAAYWTTTSGSPSSTKASGIVDLDGEPWPKVIDFGISRALAGDDVELTRAGSLLGTPEYMSPEQAEGSADVDTRTDVYSLGVMLFELLVGDLPQPRSRW